MNKCGMLCNPFFLIFVALTTYVLSGFILAWNIWF